MKQQALPFAFFKGEYIPTEKATVSIMTNALQYGTGIFGGIRGYYNPDKKTISVFRVEDHYKRFLTSVNIFGCRFPYPAEKLKEITIELLKKNAPAADVYFRPF